MANGGRWSVRRALLGRERLTLAVRVLPAGVDGMCVRTEAGEELVVVRPGLSRAEWREVVTHELVHLERGALIDSLHRHPSAGTWAAVVAREEAAVDREVARRLIPAAELIEWLREREGATAAEIAAEFEVTEGLARRVA